MPDHDNEKPRPTLTPGDIVSHRLGRRGALAALGATVVGASALVASQPSRAEAKASDSDPSDPPGRGRTGFTDRDSGPGADGAGRGVCAERGFSDADPNDAAGRGRGPCR